VFGYDLTDKHNTTNCNNNNNITEVKVSPAKVVNQKLKVVITDDNCVVARWCNGKAFGFAISRSLVQILLEATLHNTLRQLVYTYVPLSLSSIT